MKKSHNLKLAFKFSGSCSIDPKKILIILKEKILRNLFYSILSPQVEPEYIQFSVNGEFGRDTILPITPQIGVSASKTWSLLLNFFTKKGCLAV